MCSRRAVLMGAAGACFAPGAWAQELGDISSDIAILRDAYETLHPGLYRYAAPAQVSARIDALARAWSRPQTRAEAYLSLSRFLATVQCGHTYANFYNQSDAVQAELFDSRRMLPFHFAWLDERMVVLANHSAEARLEPGTEILSVDRRSTPAILRALMPYARADGGNDAKRRALLEVGGFNRFETFDVFYGLLFNPGAAARLRVRRPGATRAETLTVATIDTAARRNTQRGAAANNAPAWTVTYPETQTAVLTMPTWALYNSSWNWSGFLDETFAAFAERGVSKLIVDVRGNEGGLDCGHDIIARLIDQDLPLAAYERRVRYQRVPDRLNQYLDTWDNSFRDWGDRVEPLADGFYRARSGSSDADPVIAPKGPRFRGDVRVLIGPSNSSATFQFATTIKARGLGTLIGEPTGGNQRGINGGAFFFLRLPASGLEADLPLIGTFAREPRPDAGIEPDVLVRPSAALIAANRDAVMEAALR